MISRNILIKKEDGITTPGPTLQLITGIREEFHYVSIQSTFYLKFLILAATKAIVKSNWSFYEEFQSFLIQIRFFKYQLKSLVCPPLPLSRQVVT